jgi:hypothetical protein
MSTAAMDQRAFVMRHTPFVCYGRISSLLAIGKKELAALVEHCYSMTWSAHPRTDCGTGVAPPPDER